MKEELTLRSQWLIKAPLAAVFNTLTDFEHWPEYFPRVAESVEVVSRQGQTLEMEATVKSFGGRFPVRMVTRIVPGRGFISENDSPKFGTSGHEEVLLSECPEGTLIDYTYQVVIHKRWLRLVAQPLIGTFSMRYWQKAVIDELRRRLEG